ncbi:hypothetical protein WA1_09105 [Scytonema hofmannii PCC 7110]|uniref:Non-ribosomal peptide synthetase n=2 Tax=Scytonema TaxID=1203 RepID=A0A139WS98_9CYAN|nr:hybrid non-ribosomal peptide synthetase/type I polyketide synthase [Scytonema hofmannii]KYC35299.1 hypothetical protein WA1_09105 [Scytonema hofmannii PCC 7110]
MESIAIIGIGCRFPRAKNPETFWQLLRDGVDAISEVPAQRWDIDAFYDPNPATPGKMSTRWGGFLEQVDQFDTQFFGIAPQEAHSMDPQQRLLLEVAWEALEDAGQIPERLANTSTGVFVGISTYDYSELLLKANAIGNAYTGSGNTQAIVANRLSYFFNFHGPSMAVDTACSSSLVAVHLACNSIWQGESTLALVGGVNLLLSPVITINFTKAGFMANDGRCKTFDARANGYVRGEGAGVIVLKPLSQALSDGDPIYAVIRGSAVNQDGRTNGLMAPNRWAQEAVLRQAYRKAGVQPSQVQYVEAHGTGTLLGDPMEMKALGAVLSSERPSFKPHCAVGSVKTNIGHLEAAAGIAGLIKVALSLKHRQIPPSLHFQKPNPYIPFEDLLLRVPQTLEPWPETSSTAIASVSSFGFGGTNAHVVLESGPEESQKAKGKSKNKQVIESPLHLLTLSAKSEQALLDLACRYQALLADHPTESLADVCFTANTGRAQFAHRLAIVAKSNEDLTEQLSAFANGDKPVGLVNGHVQDRKRPQIAFLFTGQGAQYFSMGRQLYDTQPTFRRALERCDELLRPFLEQPLLSVLFEKSDDSKILLSQTVYTQPALFALEYALAELWCSWGIVPDIVMGHSVGEYVAACVAGVLSLEDGLQLIAERGRLIQALPEDGMMAAVFADEARVVSAIDPHKSRIAIAAINGPNNIVISGNRATVEAVLKQLHAEGINARPLQVSHGFHSPLMEPILDKFEHLASQVQFAAPRIPLVSNLTGQILPTGEIPDETYWRRHLRETVQFAAGMHTLADQGYNLFIEVGPHPTLLGMGKHCLPPDSSTWLPSMRKGQDDLWVLLNSLSALYIKGTNVNWVGFYQDYQLFKISLPTYPFQRKRYWVESVATMNGNQLVTKTSNPQVDIASKITSGDTISTTKQKDSIQSILRSSIARWLQLAPDEIDIYASFLEMGADSIILLDIVRSLENTFRVKVEIRQLFEELTTIDTLSTYIEQNLSPEWDSVSFSQSELEPKVNSQQPEMEAIKLSQQLLTASHPPVAVPTDKVVDKQDGRSVSETVLEGIIGQQIQLMSQQLELLRNDRLQSPTTTTASPNYVSNPTNSNLPVAKSSSSVQPKSPGQKDGLIPIQQEYLRTFIARYTKRTQGSKRHKQTYHPVLADKRAASAFRLSTKEMVYPIVGKGSMGSKFWDVDDNEYIDISMGFGVHLFGHRASFIMEALEERIEEGIQIGPQSNLAGEVAQLICELTGMERVTFCNTGTEAVMTAMRLARGVTGRTKIAQFAGAYHGQSDGTLVEPSITADGKVQATPLNGVSPHVSEETLVLTYGDPRSLDIIKAHEKELAAVLVEPVQSGRPDIQPKEFLQELRQLTKAAGIALIFDEVITGFRLHPGGAQAWFGVEADIATYGKVVGGGMPIGVVAGSAAYMNAIDGGAWNYGDDSSPEAETIFCGGTFNKNPLTTATAWAVLKYLKEQGPTLHQNLNRRTSQLAETLNAYFKQENVPIKMVYCGSVFRFSISGNVTDVYTTLEMDLFFYHLIHNGVYTWEGRRFFLSTAHTDEDIDFIIRAVKKSVEEMRAGGFLLPKDKQRSQEVLSSAITSDTFQTRDEAANHKNGKATQTEAPEQLRFVAQTKQETSSADTDFSLPAIVPAPKERHLPFPLTDIQQAYWLGQSRGFEMGNVMAHSYYEFEVVDLDIERCNQVLQRLIERHEMLRAIVLPDGQQKILEQVPTYQIEVFDQRGKDPQEVKSQLASIRERMSQQGPTTDQWPLFEIQAHRLDDRLVRIHLSISLMIVDGRADSVMTQEAVILYQNPDAFLPPIDLSFRDYVLALNTLENSEEYQRSLQYWKNRFSTLPPAPELPLAKNPASVSHPQFVRRNARLEPKIWLQLKTRAIRAGLTPTVALCAAYCEALAAWSKTRHFTLNILFFNRLPLHPQVNDIIGNFSSTILLEVDNFSEIPFVTRAKRLQSQLLTDLERSDVSGVRVLRELNRVETRTSRAAMPVVFASSLNLNSNSEETPNSPVSGKEIYSCLQTPQVQLDHEVYEQDGALVCNWDAVEELFPAGLLDDMFSAYSLLLHRLAEEEEVWQETVPQLMPPAQQEQRLTINATSAPVPADMLHTLFAAQVSQQPRQTAVISSKKILTYEELYYRSNQVAHWLRRLGARPNLLVAVVMEKGWEQVVAVLGVLQSGAAYLPIDPALPKERLWYLLAQSEVGLVLTQSWIDDNLEWPESVQRLCVDSKDLEKVDNHPLEVVQKPEDLAYVIFTSGSTGLPKGVMIDHRGAVNTICDINQRFGIGPEDRLLALSSLSFDLSVYDIFGILAAGGTIIIPDASVVRDPAHWAELLVREKVTIWNSVPALMQMLIEYLGGRSKMPPCPLRLVLLSGDWIPVVLPNQIEALSEGVQVIGLGGATEASIWSVLHPIEEVDSAGNSIPYGKPMVNQRLYVLNSALEPCPNWVVGRLYIGGIGLAIGYWRDEEKTKAYFINHPKTGERLYRTGDIGRYLPDGNIEFLGREDFQVKVQGYRIELGEIEAALEQHRAVRNAVATAVGEFDRTKRLVAYVVPDRDSVPDVSELRSFLAEKLPEYMVPSAFVPLEALPLTPNGKVDRKALPIPEQVVSEREKAFVAPSDPLELQLAQIWEDLLHIHPVGVRDNFFDKGGNSLLAVRLMTQIQKLFEKELSLSTLLQRPTIECLASILRQQTAFVPQSSLVEIQPAGSKPPFFCVHPVGGNVLCYVDLARLLGQEQPFYGLQSPGLNGEREPYTQVKDMATHYIEALRTIQPEGPYLLGGWSMGGIVAFEMAQQLHKQNQEVAALILLDSRAPVGTSNLDDAKLLSWFVRDLGGRFAKDLTVSHDQLQGLGPDEGLQYVLEQARKANILPADVGLMQIQRLLQVFKANTRAMWSYKPEVYPNRVILLRPNEMFSEDFDNFGDHTLGWSKFVSNQIEIHTVPGNHYTILANPHVKFLAERLRNYLDQVSGKTLNYK